MFHKAPPQNGRAGNAKDITAQDYVTLPSSTTEQTAHAIRDGSQPGGNKEERALAKMFMY